LDLDATECALFQPTSAPSTSPSMAPSNNNGGFDICFSGRNQVTIKGKGQVDMKDLHIGDMVLVDNNDKFERVYSFGHFHDVSETKYLQIFTKASSRPLEVSGNHMVFVEGQQSVPAWSLEVGNRLMVVHDDDDDFRLREVVAIKTIMRKGSYAPFTQSGTIVVNEILASCFVAFQGKASRLSVGFIATPLSYQWLAHTFEAPHRLYCIHLGLCTEETYTPQGVSHWVHVPLQITHWMFRQHALVFCVMFVPALIFFWLMALLEAALFQYPSIILVLVILVIGIRGGRDCVIAHGGKSQTSFFPFSERGFG